MGHMPPDGNYGKPAELCKHPPVASWEVLNAIAVLDLDRDAELHYPIN